MLCFKPTVPTASFPTNPVLTPSSAPPSKVLVGWYSYDSLSPEGPTLNLYAALRPLRLFSISDIVSGGLCISKSLFSHFLY